MKMRTKFERLLSSLRQQLILKIFVVGAAVVVIPQQSFCADHSVVQWRNNSSGNIVTNTSESATSVSHSLNWRKPAATDADSVSRNSQRVVFLPETESSIVLVQHVESALPPQPTTITTTPTPSLPGTRPPKQTDPYVQEHFNRNIPAQKPNPPQGATNTSVSPKPSTTNFSPDQQLETPPEPKSQKTSNVTTSNSNGKVEQDQHAASPFVPESAQTNGTGVGSGDFSGLVPEPLSLTEIDKNMPTHDCKSVGFKPINEISCDIKPRPGRLPVECPLDYEPYTGRHFSQTCFQWKASAVCTKGAYFENVQLERYGHSVCPLLEPVISGVKFFTTIPVLPYKAGLTPPNECVYTLGHYRVGNCAPHTLDPLPISVRAILFEGAAVAGAVAIIP
ncbi:MAG: hypothetical protein LBJ00_06055 [Planctomycetaceae bacterium]|nr:hypothetical protein [Planctomycetaceae bacterium]